VRGCCCYHSRIGLISWNCRDSKVAGFVVVDIALNLCRHDGAKKWCVMVTGSGDVWVKCGVEDRIHEEEGQRENGCIYGSNVLSHLFKVPFDGGHGRMGLLLQRRGGNAWKVGNEVPGDGGAECGKGG
jgi:hypothetical protein